MTGKHPSGTGHRGRAQARGKDGVPTGGKTDGQRPSGKPVGKTGRVLFAALALALMVSAPAPVRAAEEDSHLQIHALRYATMIQRGYQTLEHWITQRSTEASTWDYLDIPPSAMGWQYGWTESGIRARYCDNVLVVYMGAAEAKGIGRNHRAVQVAPRDYSQDLQSNILRPRQPLMWLEGGGIHKAGGVVEALPGCFSRYAHAPLPSGRAAWSGRVVDPWADIKARETSEIRTLGCAAGTHGAGLYQSRTRTVDINGKGQETGEPVFGDWVTLRDNCRADYTYEKTFTLACSWYEGEPQNSEMSGSDFWKQTMQVTASGEQAIGEPRFISSTCWDRSRAELPPPPPEPTITSSSSTESRTVGCPSGYSGSITQTRTVTRRSVSLTFISDSEGFSTITYSAWSETSNSCQQPPPPARTCQGRLEDCETGQEAGANSGGQGDGNPGGPGPGNGGNDGPGGSGTGGNA